MSFVLLAFLFLIAASLESKQNAIQDELDEMKNPRQHIDPDNY